MQEGYVLSDWEDGVTIEKVGLQSERSVPEALDLVLDMLRLRFLLNVLREVSDRPLVCGSGGRGPCQIENSGHPSETGKAGGTSQGG